MGRTRSRFLRISDSSRNRNPAEGGEMHLTVSGAEGSHSGLVRRTRNAVGGNPSQVRILYPPLRIEKLLKFFTHSTNPFVTINR
ncbi:MAG: hypothetical protein G01um101420_88 [Parcubacteria group bacterium Gr01-1014_20]|nr:MAG: hypothetical protein G01um101420_88 [Parcubacteria group bacterium Gr01-1014_20]